ncbi:amidohydrolase [Alicyclobacillus mengziensis]|uniref:5-methylthioadenosine/S-adenosylhomocysteine deaminase n=1 Tax=Alicyclobacillus mengziensis TaxID=2931921 RepID=A0A9X7VW33_9BACL|nr:amidohydrolase [Alicyclobacillus mengziensis]QSO45690.1 amidohydrolase [Alicyclobacillus mengziensis]
MNQRVLLEVGGLIETPTSVITGPSYILWNQSTIEETGAGEYLGDRSLLTVIRRRNRIAMPGLVNTHGHAAMTLFRSAGDDVPLEKWLKEKIYPLERQLTKEAVYWGTQLACWEMLTSGTTCFTDMYFYMNESARAVHESGIRGVLSIGLLGFTEEMQKQGLADSKSHYETWHGAGEGRISVMLGPHAPYTCPPAFLLQITELSQLLDLPMQIHLSETAYEVAESYRQHGTSPIGLMHSLGVLNRPVLAAHCVHVDDKDISLLAAHDVRVAHNPQSNLKLGSGIAPAVKMRQAGITLGLGTDGAASNNNLDMFEELRLAATLHKGVLQDATAITAPEALEMATVSGARAVFRPTGDGTLTAGAVADVVLLNLESPRFLPTYDLVSNIVYSASAEDVTDVFVAGQEVVRKGEPVTLDTEQIRYQIERITRNFERK